MLVEVLPPGQTPQATSVPRAGQLPVQLTSFVGREREIAEVERLLAATRMLTLTGAGGSGKTRLALEVVARVGTQYEDGVAWVELASLDAPELLAAHVAGTLGIRQEGDRPTTEALTAALRERSLILVLDNCEHLVDECARLATALLQECPRLRILATSREALGIAGERAWLVPPLAVPRVDSLDAQAVAESEAVRLFVERAQSALGSFELTDANAPAVARICRRLDGLPLAIEFAAARVRVLAPEQIVARLEESFNVLASRARGVPTRHQTLRAAVDWSYQLLPQPERTLLQRLSVFAGGFTLDAVEAVCAGDGLEPDEILDVLAALVDKSLVVMHERDGVARYSLLETVRQYAHEYLRAEGDVEALRNRHADFYVAWVQGIEPRIFLGGSDSALLARLDGDLGNLRTAAEWLESDVARTDRALQLATALEWFWFVRGGVREGRERLDATLARGADAPALTRARALTALGLMAFCQGDLAGWHAASSEAASLLRPFDRPRDLAWALTLLGTAVALSKDATAGLAILEEAIAVARPRDRESLVSALTFLGFTRYMLGKVDEARAAWRRGSSGGRTDLLPAPPERRAGTPRVQPRELRAGAGCLPARAWRRHRRRRPVGVALAISAQAGVAVIDGDVHRAARLLAASTSIRQRIGAPPRPDETAFQKSVISRIKAALGDTSFSAAWEGGRLLGVAHALEEARSTSVPTDAVAMGRHGSPCGAKSTMRSCPTASRKRISPVVDLSGQYRMGMRRGGPSCPRASV